MPTAFIATKGPARVFVSEKDAMAAIKQGRLCRPAMCWC